MTNILLESNSHFIWDNTGNITKDYFYYDDQELNEITEDEAISLHEFFYHNIRNDLKDITSKHIQLTVDYNYNKTKENIQQMKYSAIETELPEDFLIDYNTVNPSYKRILEMSDRYINLPDTTGYSSISNIPDNISEDWKNEIKIYYNAVIKPAMEKFSYKLYKKLPSFITNCK